MTASNWLAYILGMDCNHQADDNGLLMAIIELNRSWYWFIMVDHGSYNNQLSLLLWTAIIRHDESLDVVPKKPWGLAGNLHKFSGLPSSLRRTFDGLRSQLLSETTHLHVLLTARDASHGHWALGYSKAPGLRGWWPRDDEHHSGSLVGSIAPLHHCDGVGSTGHWPLSS